MKVEQEIERAFRLNADEQTVRTRLLAGMKRLGFSLISKNESELKFRHGSPFASEPSSRIYVTVRFDLANRGQAIAVLKAPYAVVLGPWVDWLGWTGVNRYYDSALPLVEQIALGNDAQAVKSFLDLCKRVARNMILFWILFSGFIIIVVVSDTPRYCGLPPIWCFVNLYCGLVILAVLLLRIGIDVYGYSQIKTIR